MDKDRVKDVAKIYEKHYQTLAPNVQGFLQDYYTTTGKTFNITSGKRAPGQAGNSGNESKHVKGEAFDISADHMEDYAYLLNTQEGLAMLSKYNLGVIDETDPEMMKKTGATGAHFHIGTDSKFSTKAKERYNNFDKAQPIYSYKQRTTLGIPQTEEGNHFQGDGHNHEEKLATVQAEPTFYNTTQTESLERGMEKSVIAQTKEEKSQARKELKEQQVEKTREQLIEAEFAKILQQGDEGTYVEEFGGNRRQSNEPLPEMHNVNVQRQMPQMPTIFQFEEGGIVGEERLKPLTPKQAFGIDPIYKDDHQRFLADWYENRQIPDPYLNEALNLDRQTFLSRARNFPDYNYVDNIRGDKNITGNYDSESGKLSLTRNAPQHIKTHELNHYLNDMTSEGGSYTATTNNLVVPNEIKSADELEGIYKEKYDYFSSPEEVQSRLMVLRKEAGIKPTQIVTDEFLEKFFKDYKGGNDNINDLLELSRGKNGLLNLLNYVADNGDKSEQQIA